MLSNKKVAFSTTIFPMEESYLHDFFASLQKQTYKRFDIVVLNDGYDDLEKFKYLYSDLKIVEIKYNNTPAKNREYAINYIKRQSYDIMVFGDSDDYFSENRVEKSLELLNNNDIVVNDLSLCNEFGIVKEKYISNRIKNNTKIKIDFIKDKNIFGFTNTALKLKILDRVGFDEKLIAVDWYLFSDLLLRNCKAIFTNEAISFYRQHDLSLIGLGNISKKYISLGLNVKFKHCQSFPELRDTYNEINKLRHQDIDELYTNLVDKRIIYPLWWEEVRSIKT